MGGKEIVTLQFGAAANYVGAHFWNLQDEGEFVERADGSAPVFDRTRLFAPEGGAAFPRVISVGARGPGGYRAGRYDGLRAPIISLFSFFCFFVFFLLLLLSYHRCLWRTVKFCMLNMNMPRLG
eukprot:TRINITY_DN3123_c1_g1_i1.p1 TRINITY_DN3123_c1_g1~~TRINITY_DN3123_c1_g1_i1.p1  ORF type:complete len:124 (-),score=11.19 TRINITY_DN3123_c1_g1_i1:40-411(-)